MNEYRSQSPEDLNRFPVLIRFLNQMHSQMQNINDETERFNRLINQLGEVLKEHRQEFSDLESTLLDYEDYLERVKSINLPEQRNNQSPGHLASRTEGREPSKSEGE